MSLKKLAVFREAYPRNLSAAMLARPEEYGFPVEQAPRVALKILDAIEKNGIRTVDINGRGFKATCKELGIKHTYKAIEAFLTGE